jgi:cytochrome b6-f complex iron-sulfur subunit
MVKPSVRYEEATKFKIGKPESFPVGTVKKLEEKGVFIFSGDDGIHAISAVCTHLGCVVAHTETGFACPCHGSKYNANGKVIGGPRPESCVARDKPECGRHQVDSAMQVPVGTKFKLYA